MEELDLNFTTISSEFGQSKVSYPTYVHIEYVCTYYIVHAYQGTIQYVLYHAYVCNYE